MADIKYTRDGIFTRFFPTSDAGEQAYREMMDQNDGVAAVLTVQEKSVIQQLKKAGYTVRKAQKPKQEEIDNILAELEA